MEFDKYGLIQPDTKHELSSAEFKETFVNSFPNSRTRSDIFSAYIAFTEAFSKEVTNSFTQWIGGSFTTQKENPNDIDILTILRKSDYEKNKEMMESRFRKFHTRSVCRPKERIERRVKQSSGRYQSETSREASSIKIYKITQRLPPDSDPQHQPKNAEHQRPEALRFKQYGGP